MWSLPRTMVSLAMPTGSGQFSQHVQAHSGGKSSCQIMQFKASKDALKQNSYGVRVFNFQRLLAAWFVHGGLSMCA